MYIDLSAKDWAMSALLGEARRSSNEAIRRSNQDRGNTKNIHVDLMGSLSEIAAMKALRTQMSIVERDNTKRSMFRPEGGGGKLGADLVLSARNLKLDVKTFDCEDNKRFFAINASKHKDLQGVCDGYFCVICPKYASKAYLIDFVPYADVSEWPSKSLGTYGAASHNLPILDFLKRYANADVLGLLKAQQRHDRAAIAEEINSQETRKMFLHHFVGSDKFIRERIAKA